MVVVVLQALTEQKCTKWKMGNSVRVPCFKEDEYIPQTAVIHDHQPMNCRQRETIHTPNETSIVRTSRISDKDKKSSRNVLRLGTNWIQNIFDHVHELIHPKSLFLNNSNSTNIHHSIRDQQQPQQQQSQQKQSQPASRTTPPLLHNCATVEEQYAYIQQILAVCQHLHGIDGLHAVGLEYRKIPCDEHKDTCNYENQSVTQKTVTNDNTNDVEKIKECATDITPHEKNELLQSNRIGDEEGEKNEVFQSNRIGDEEGENDELGVITFVELAKVKSEKFLSLSNRSDSLLSDAGSSNDADIGTTPSLATTTAFAWDVDEDVTHIGTQHIAMPQVDQSTMSTSEKAALQYPNSRIEPRFCHLCERRLYDRQSNTLIKECNRKQFIADGEMYELVSRLVQEYAHSIMMDEGDMKWINIDNHEDDTTISTHMKAMNGTNSEPIRILINKDHPCLQQNSDGNSATYVSDHPTILICTGRGKVRGGTFSRHHLICTGLERSTALPFIQEARHRKLHIAVLDPNVHGEANGYTTFTKSMNYLESYFGVKSHVIDHVPDQEDKPITACNCRDLYILSHSASGGHLARYFLEKSQSHYLLNIRAIAFTDSTHNIQWAKGSHQVYLYELLQSVYCIYFRCSSGARDTIAGDGDSKWYLHPAGEVVNTDSFWRHRFGSIRTVWAGTNEHSQTNWYAHGKIWEHFDQFLFAK
jgi:hypothetical protein